MNISATDQIVIAFSNKLFDGLKIDQPSLFVRSTSSIKLFEEPTRFINEQFIQNGRTPSKHTWSAAGYALKSWFEFLQAINRDWQDAQRQDRINYRDAYASAISPRTGHHYDAGTIRNRMIVIREFYNFAYQNEWYSGDIASGEFDTGIHFQSPRSDPLAHIRRGATGQTVDRDLPKKLHGNRIHPFQALELRKLLNHLGPRASDCNGDQRPTRDRILADLGWVVGLRLDEIHQLTTLQFLCLHLDSSQPLIDQALTIRRGKGAKSRTVAIPNWLVQDIQIYITGERAEVLKVGKISTKTASTTLMLSGTDANIPGIPVKHRRLQQIIEEACFAVGFINEVEYTDPETLKVQIKKITRHSIHDLRHTYAVLTYHAELLLGNTEPWKKIQAQLGHASLQTTIDTYLRHLEIFGEKQRLIDVRKMIGL